jgi:hypothetical protein
LKGEGEEIFKRGFASLWLSCVLSSFWGRVFREGRSPSLTYTPLPFNKIIREGG